MQMYVACLGSQFRVVDDGYDFFFPNLPQPLGRSNQSFAEPTQHLYGTLVFHNAHDLKTMAIR